MTKRKQTTEKQEQGQQLGNIEKPVLGINQNTQEEDGTQNYLTYALNTVVESSSGDMLVLAKENANYLKESFISTVKPSTEFKVCGSVKGEKNEVYIFLATLDGSESEIGILNSDETYETLVYLPSLNFSLLNPINGVYRLRLGCEKVIYWAEQNAQNALRYFNTTRPEEFQNSNGDWQIQNFDLFYAYQRPTFQEVRAINTGGNLLAGSYNVNVQLLDENLNATPWIYATEPVPIFHDVITGHYYDIIGSSNAATDALGGLLTPTTKSLQITLGNLDENFPYYRLCLIQASSFNKEVTKVLVTPPISTDNNSYTFTGFEDNLSNEVDESVFEITQTPMYPELLVQQDNRLLMGKVNGVPYDLCSFQKYASKIATGYVSKLVPASDYTKQGNYKNPSTYWLDKTYQGFEIYALGIVYVFPDFETPVYHIPGRPMNYYYHMPTHTITSLNNGEGDLMPWNNGEVLSFTKVSLGTTPEASYTANPDVQKWQIRDTSSRYPGTSSSGYMSYHENSQGTYPNRDTCGEEEYWGLDFTGEKLEGKPIRHHRFPSRMKEPHVETVSTEVTTERLLLTLSPEEMECTYTEIYVTVQYTKEGIIQDPVELDPITLEDFIDDSYTFIIDEANGEGSLTDYSVVGITSETLDNIEHCFITELEIKILRAYTNVNTIRLLGFQLGNIEYPHPGVIGHYIVVGLRDEFNRTILDAGLVSNLLYRKIKGKDHIGFGYFKTWHHPYSVSPEYLYSFMPRVLFDKKLLPASYIRLEQNLETAPTIFAFKKDDKGATWGGNNFDVIMIQRYIRNVWIDIEGCGEIYPIEKKQEFAGISEDFDNFYPGGHASNLSYTNMFLGLKVNRSFRTHDKRLTYSTLCVNRDIHRNLDNITYVRTHPNTNIATSILDKETVYGGDTIISKWVINNGTFYKAKGSPWKLVAAIVAVAAAAVLSVFTFGAGAPVLGAAIAVVGTALTTAEITLATYIVVVGLTLAASIGLTATSVEYHRQRFDDQGLAVMVQDEEIETYWDMYTTTQKSEAYVNESIDNFFIESPDINIELRLQCNTASDAVGRILKTAITDYPGNSFITFENYVLKQWFVYDTEESNEKFKWKFRGIPTPEIYLHNPDYVRRNLQKKYFALPDTYDCCSPCLENYKNRIHWSNQSFQEEAVDHYRVFQPFNYIDMDGSAGELTNLFIKGKNLFAHCTESLWQVPANLQTQITDELVTYIGTGEYLSLPPIQIVDDKDTPCGSQHKWGTTLAKHGDFFVSEKERKIYLFGAEGQPNPINLEGIKYWSEEEIPIQLNYNLSIFNNLPHHPFGVGFISVYDPKYNRYIITKKDYKLLVEPSVQEIQYNRKQEFFYVNVESIEKIPSVLFFNETDNIYYIWTQTIDSEKGLQLIVEPVLDYTKKPTLFQDCSWTLSFSMYTNSWISWHSYTPNLYLSNSETFYSIQNNATISKLYRHNWKNQYCHFYDNFEQHIIDMSFKNPIQDFTWEHIEVHSKSVSYDVENKEYIENRFNFFDEVIFYNKRQSTGLKNIQIIQQDIDNTFMENRVRRVSGSVSAYNTEGVWAINDIRDYVINPNIAIFTKKWDEIYSKYSIDKVSNENNINHDKQWYQLEPMRSKFLNVRLISNTDRDNATKQILTKYITNSNIPSY